MPIIEIQTTNRDSILVVDNISIAVINGVLSPKDTIDVALTMECFLPQGLDFREIELFIENDETLYTQTPIREFLDIESLRALNLEHKL